MKEYWLYLESYTFLWRNNNNILFYNTLSGRNFLIDQHPDIEDIICSWENPKSSYCVKISNDAIKKKAINDLIEKIRSSYSGDIISTDDINGKPFVMRPILSFQKGKKQLSEIANYTGDNVALDLQQINISLDWDIGLYSVGIKDSCYLSNLRLKENKLSTFNVLNFLKSIIEIFRGSIHFYCSDYLKLKEDNCVIWKCIDVYNNIVVHLPLKLMDYEVVLSRFWDSKLKLKIYIELDVGIEKIEQTILRLKESSIDYHYCFLIVSAEEYAASESIMTRYDIVDSEIKIIYNGDNIDFFEKYVYLATEDLVQLNLTKRNIYAHMEINTYDFGILSLMPDGFVYGNLLQAPIGSIEDDVKILVYKEIDQGFSWKRIRNTDPCDRCVYQWLCPSPSTYELAIGKSNLCHINL